MTDYEDSDAMSEVRDIIQSILMTDIVGRYSVKRVDVLERILMFLCDNIGNISSLNSIANALSSSGRGVHKDLVYEYAGYLEAACLVDRVETYDIKGKAILGSKYKYYLADVGIRNALLGFRTSDIPGNIENIVYLELKSHGYRVRVGSNGGREIDFVAERNGELIYIQAAMALEDESTISREFGNLRGIADNYPKYVVVLNRGPLDTDVDGIICMGLKDFLLMDDLRRPSVQSDSPEAVHRIERCVAASHHILRDIDVVPRGRSCRPLLGCLRWRRPASRRPRCYPSDSNISIRLSFTSFVL